jgi:hypothetical protein
MLRFAGMSLEVSASSSAGQPAPLEQIVVAVDLGDERLLRRHRMDLRGRQPEQRGGRRDLAIDLGGNRRRGFQLIPERVDLVQHGEAAGYLCGVVAGEVARPHFEVRLRDAGVRGEDEQDRMRVGEKIERELRLGTNRVQPRRVDDHEPLLQQGVRKLMIACRQHGTSISASPSGAGSLSGSASSWSPSARASTSGTRFICETFDSVSLISAGAARSSGNVTHSSGKSGTPSPSRP